MTFLRFSGSHIYVSMSFLDFSERLKSKQEESPLVPLFKTLRRVGKREEGQPQKRVGDEREKTGVDRGVDQTQSPHDAWEKPEETPIQDRCWFSLNGTLFCWKLATWRLQHRNESRQCTYLCHEHKIAWQKDKYPHATVQLFESTEEDSTIGHDAEEERIESDEYEAFIPLHYLPRPFQPPLPNPPRPDHLPMWKTKLVHINKRAAVWDRTGGRCWYCGLQTNPWRDYCIEHVLPQARGGSHDYENLVPACRTCNLRKKDKTLEEFRVYLQSRAIPEFTAGQLAYLRDIGLSLPDPLPAPPAYLFWFETQGLTITGEI